MSHRLLQLDTHISGSHACTYVGEEHHYGQHMVLKAVCFLNYKQPGNEASCRYKLVDTVTL